MYATRFHCGVLHCNNYGADARLCQSGKLWLQEKWLIVPTAETVKNATETILIVLRMNSVFRLDLHYRLCGIRVECRTDFGRKLFDAEPSFADFDKRLFSLDRRAHGTSFRAGTATDAGNCYFI